MALSIRAMVYWRLPNGTPQTREAPVIMLTHGDGSAGSWLALHDTTDTESGVVEFLRKVARAGKMSMFVPRDAGLLAFPQGREIETLDLKIRDQTSDLTLAEPIGHDLTVEKSLPLVINEHRTSQHIAVLKLRKGSGFAINNAVIK